MKAIRLVVKKLEKSIVRRGLWQTAVYILNLLIDYLRRLAGRGKPSASQSAADEDFDSIHNVDTSGIVALETLKIPGRNWMFGCFYEPINPRTFRKMVGELPIDHQQFTFIDFGCGKGRALVMAADFPFRRIIGIEFSPELAATAEKNMQSFRSANRKCGAVQVLCVDAINYSLPEEPIVAFFYNPFEEQVMAQVVRNVAQSVQNCPRPFIVAYATPLHDHLWSDADMKPIYRSSDYSLFSNAFLEQGCLTGKSL